MKKSIFLVLLCFGLGLSVMAYPIDSTNVLKIEMASPAVMPEQVIYYFPVAEYVPISPLAEIGTADVIVKRTKVGFLGIEKKPPKGN